jgi:hypothetical protein
MHSSFIAGCIGPSVMFIIKPLQTHMHTTLMHHKPSKGSARTLPFPFIQLRYIQALLQVCIGPFLNFKFE